MSSLSYIAIIADPASRHISLGIGEAAMMCGAFIGTLTNGPIIDNWGLDVLGYINVGINVITGMVVICLVPEIYKETADKYSWREVLKPHHILDTFKCIFRPRPGKRRLFLNMSLTVYCTLFMTVQVTTSVGFLYFVKEEGMSLTTYSLFNSFAFMSKAISMFVLWLSKKMQLDKLDMAIIFSGLHTGAYILLSVNGGGVSALQWIAIALMGGHLAVFAVLRNIQVSLVDQDETGKLFAYDAIIQLLCFTVLSIGINLIYGWSVAFWPEFIFSVSSLVGLISLAVMVSLILMIQRNDNIIVHHKEHTDAKPIQ